MIRKSILLFLLTSLIACGDNVSFRRSADYATRLSQAEKIAIYPAKAEVNIVDVIGVKERQHKYEYFIESNLSDILSQALNDKGYRTKIIHKKDLKDNQSYGEFNIVFDKFRKEKNRIFSEKDTSNKAYAYNIVTDLGGASSILYEKMSDDIAIFSDYTETLQTAGVQAFSASLGGRQIIPSEKALLTIGIIDIKNSKILWTYSSFHETSQIKSNDYNELVIKNKIEALIQKLLDKLPNKVRLDK